MQFVAIDPAAVYPTAIRTPDCCPTATIVVDHIHVVKLANETLTKVCRGATWDLRERRGRKTDPAWADRRRLLSARERLSQKSFAKTWNQITTRNPARSFCHLAVHRAPQRRSTPDTAPAAPLPVMVHRFPDPRTTDPGHQHRHLMARGQRVRPYRNPQRRPPRARTDWSNKSNALSANSGTETTQPAAYDSTAPENGGPQRGLATNFPVKIEEPTSRREEDN